MEDVLLNKEEVLALVQKLEGIIGMKCFNVGNLKSDATDEEYYSAWRQDRNWFRGYADTIYDNT